MRDLHADLKSAKNEMHNDQAWLVLFDVFVSDTEVLRLVNNETAITYNGDEYQPWPIAFEQMEENTAGDLPFVTVTVANVDRTVSGYLESHGGLLNRKVTIRVVHASNLAVTALESNLRIREVSATEEAVSFRLSHHPFFEIDLPHQKYYRHRCRWAFKSTECGWQSSQGGNSTACDKSLEGNNGCNAHSNTARFGGFPGIPRRRI